ncbi:HD domain-containing protein [Patescibacteria group bacterium]|nr:HD domain-containing protein [Patescibacteria group bacterium]
MTDQPSTPTNTSLARHIDFLFEVGSLRYAIRTWSQFLNPNCQNLTEHTLRVVWIALVLAKHEGITDTSKIIKMALVHDISESRSVDVNYVSRQYADRHEDKAISDTLGDTLLLDEFLPIWEEYEERQTLEAKIVKDADHLDVDLELRELEAMGNKLGQALMPSRQDALESRFFTETARKMWQEIQNSDPHHWHLMARRG